MARVGVSAVTFGATEILSDMGDEVAKAVGEEAKAFLNSSKGDGEAAAYWAMQRSQIAAMKAFQLALTELTEPDAQGLPAQKLVIVIDELDRCRPDYALSVLEIIKHFFNERGVHFVLGVNLKELQNSVRARYGSGVNAAKYLQKFVSVEMPLKNGTGIHTGPSDYISHFGEVAKRTGAQNSFVFKYVFDHLSMANHHFTITLRDVEKIAVLIALIPNQEPQTTGERILLAGCIVLKIIAPQLLEKARRGELEFADLDNPFLLTKRTASDNSRYDIKVAWLFAAKRDGNVPIRSEDDSRSMSLFVDADPQEALRLVIANWLDGFEINSL